MAVTLVRSLSAGHLPPPSSPPGPRRSWSANNLAFLEEPPTRYHTPCPRTPTGHTHTDSARAPAPAAEAPRQAGVCEVCFEVQDAAWLWACPKGGAGHVVVCRWCVAQHVQAKLQTTYLLLVPCPHPGCGHVLTTDDVAALTPGDWHGLAEPYRQLVRRVAARTATCAHCGHVSSRAAARCESCAAERPVCDEGSGPKTHVPVGQRLRVGLWMLAHAKTCPRCRTHIQKNGGCRHMTCTHCRHEFCWICKRPWAGHRCPAKAGLRIVQGTCLLLASPLWAPPVLVHVAGRWVHKAYRDSRWRRQTRPHRPPPFPPPHATYLAATVNREPYEAESPLANYHSEGAVGFDVARVECVMRVWPPPHAVHANESTGAVHAWAEGETRRRRLAERRVWRHEEVGV